MAYSKEKRDFKDLNALVETMPIQGEVLSHPVHASSGREHAPRAVRFTPESVWATRTRNIICF
jgi:hypothetical protein